MQDLRTRLIEGGQPLFEKLPLLKPLLQGSFLFFLVKGLLWTGVFAYAFIRAMPHA